MDIKKQTSKVKQSKVPFIITGSIAALILVIVAGVYVYEFYTGIGSWGSHQQFAEFGDFFGGTLGPVLAFLTIILLLWSIHLQTTELRETRDVMTTSTQHQEKMLKLQTNTEKRRELEDNISYHYNRLEDFLKEKSFELYFEDNIISKSFLDLVNYEPLPDDPFKGDEDPYVAVVLEAQYRLFIENLKSNNLEETQKKLVKIIEIEFFQIIESVCELHEYLFSSAVKRARYNRTLDTIEKMERYHLITTITADVQKMKVNNKFKDILLITV